MTMDSFPMSLSSGGCVRAPTPRCTRIGKKDTNHRARPTTCASSATTLCENNIQLSTTAGCINNYTNQKTKLSEPSKKMRTEVASCYFLNFVCFNIQVGFLTYSAIYMS